MIAKLFRVGNVLLGPIHYYIDSEGEGYLLSKMAIKVNFIYVHKMSRLYSGDH